MDKRVFIMNFKEDSKSYQAFSELKNFHADKKVHIEQMAVIQNSEEERLQIKEFIDMTGPNKTSRGSIIGLLIGALGGPVGMLLGWMSGTVIGATRDTREIKEAVSVFDQAMSMISAEKTSLLLIGSPENHSFVRDYAQDDLGGRFLQLDFDLVMQEVERARETEKELQQEARKRWFNKNDSNTSE